MVLPLNTVISKFEAWVGDLEAEWPTLVEKNAMDRIALIEERITTTGKGPSGDSLKAYTEPYKKFKSNPQNYALGKLLQLGSSRYQGFTDYSLTGLWWKDIQLIQTEQEGNTVTAIVGPRSETNIKIMESLTNRDGFPLTNSEAEIDIANGNTIEEMNLITKRHFD